MEPAQTIIAKLGGPGIVAGVVKVHRTRVSNWKRPRKRGGTNGVIPQRHHRSLLDYAAERSIELHAEDFLAPRDTANAREIGEPCSIESRDDRSSPDPIADTGVSLQPDSNPGGSGGQAARDGVSFSSSSSRRSEPAGSGH
jgi:hypothetical protein